MTTLIHTAKAIEGPTTHGTSPQRYEAGQAIKPELDDHGRLVRMRYLVEPNGELVIRVSDAKRVGRELHGSLRHGWLDGAFEALGWHRMTLQGYERSWPERGDHHRSDVYRGRLPDDGLNT